MRLLGDFIDLMFQSSFLNIISSDSTGSDVLMEEGKLFGHRVRGRGGGAGGPRARGRGGGAGRRLRLRRRRGAAGSEDPSIGIDSIGYDSLDNENNSPLVPLPS